MRPDYLSRAGFDLICRARHRACRDNSDFARHLGVLVTMKRDIPADSDWTERLKSTEDLHCFETTIKIGTKMQSAAEFVEGGRTFKQKYDGFTVQCGELAAEVEARIGR